MLRTFKMFPQSLCPSIYNLVPKQCSLEWLNWFLVNFKIICLNCTVKQGCKTVFYGCQGTKLIFHFFAMQWKRYYSAQKKFVSTEYFSQVVFSKQMFLSICIICLDGVKKGFYGCWGSQLIFKIFLPNCSGFPPNFKRRKRRATIWN